jgi:alkanesulfonate monooxygenase SsuD/methylene tetrahydromethanopterin reductase-like flavin-dependent oxidoreductase (luciferase family)
VRVHHFARQLSSPFPLLAAIAARTRRIEIGTAVIDMRYENRCTWPSRRRRPI